MDVKGVNLVERTVDPRDDAAERDLEVWKRNWDFLGRLSRDRFSSDEYRRLYE